jgi:hypothetical protein
LRRNSCEDLRAPGIRITVKAQNTSQQEKPMIAIYGKNLKQEKIQKIAHFIPFLLFCNYLMRASMSSAFGHPLSTPVVCGCILKGELLFPFLVNFKIADSSPEAFFKDSSTALRSGWRAAVSIRCI